MDADLPEEMEKDEKQGEQGAERKEFKTKNLKRQK